MEFNFKLTGTTPFLMHADHIELADEIAAWRKNPDNKNLSVKGDDRSPAWTWLSYLHGDGTHIAIPSDMLMTALRTAAAKIDLLAGRGSYKSLSQSGLLIDGEYLRFENDENQIATADVWDLWFRESRFTTHVERAKKLGFSLFMKRAKIGQAKNVRVRPRFEHWAVSGRITVVDPAITDEVLRKMFEIAGRMCGLGDWRPSAPKSPGPYGMFSVVLSLIKGSRRAS